ncbi:MAG TPA: CHAT domain-containing protein [Gemmatimonadaceae bacterium]|nr:CHAT domain-containing protein [Gemmatimonadaceae bacterium]
MRSVALRIEAKGEGGAAGYPLSLFIGDDADVIRQLTDGSAPAASDLIPPDLTVANPPLHPDTNTPLEPLLTRDYLLGPTAGTELLERVGQLLFDVLNRPAIAPLWKQERDTAWANRLQAEQARRPALRLLLDIRDPALRLLPWELIRTGNNALAQQTWWPVMRWRPGQTPLPETSAFPWPFRVLVVIGCRDDDKAIQWRDEIWAVLESVSQLRREAAAGGEEIDLLWHKIDVEFFECRLPKRLKDRDVGPKEALEQRIIELKPHVIHFLGHGVPGAGAQKPGLKLFDARTTVLDDELLTAKELYGWLAGAPPRLAIINACRTANLSDLEGTWAVADALVDAEVAAVIGMQGDVRGDAAARFATGLYAALTRGMTIDTAVVEGRKRMLTVAPDDERDWALPSLVLQTLPEQVLPMEEDSPLALKRQIVSDPSLKNVAGFVGRRDERRRLRQGAELRAPTPQVSKLLLVLGESQVGKTWLVWRCLEGCLLRGHLVVNVSFKDQRKTFNAIDVMRLIRGAENEPAGVLRPALFQQFDPFNAALYHLLRGKVVPLTPGPERDDGTDFKLGIAHQDTLKQAGEIFRQCLRKLAATQTVVIVLDHIADTSGVGIVPEELKLGGDLRRELIDPIANGDVKNVRLILTAGATQLKALGLSDLAALGLDCQLQWFEPAEWELLAREFSVDRGFDRKSAEELIGWVSQKLRIGPQDARWGRGELDAIGKIMAMANTP